MLRGENPEAGDYEPNKGKEGREMGNLRQRINMGSKYKHNFNDNPPPGYYQPDNGYKLTGYNSASPFINPKPSGYRVKRDDNPDAGMYEPNKGKEGREMGNLRSRIYLGGGNGRNSTKYNENPASQFNDVPPPGYY